MSNSSKATNLKVISCDVNVDGYFRVVHQITTSKAYTNPLYVYNADHRPAESVSVISDVVYLKHRYDRSG